ncbi:Cmx/CmrA family chloramphenicol efflux MFS transporter [Saccharothrix algeriensis]|uniref:DHA1 family chloramphenicol resistance protein-like MFS transporter n=1 Tax=Saccharothrix algeriensis TaxID=173560 RepID=A0ABS2S160_9PSEU|nr:Cmx/CmrA family chloramphenicol efflux MFS transporter [Saccharothrix algeriensis]MBM7809972.1 DHA1 family chloramphenicol resistance protein-like MFS transporter [Saccharothrix algeriensis]
MPFAVYLLAMAVFAQGTSEFMLSGLVPGIAADLGVSVPQAGALTSAFALGMVVGAPSAAVLSLRRPRRRALLVFLLSFVAAHVVGALTTDFGVLLATRFAAALANAGFLAVGLATATGLVAPDAKGRATAVLLGGVTLACVAGVPAGAALGQAWGWRSAFWAVAALSAPAVLAVLRSVPAGPPAAGAPGARRELRALRRPRLLVTLLVTALVNGGTFCAFTYLAPLVTEVGGYGPDRVPVLLALFGLGTFVGVTVGGRLSDARPRVVLLPGGVALLGGWLLLAATAGDPVALAALVFAQGALSFAVGSTLITRVLYAADEAPSLGGSFATAALNAGATAGPLLGGAALAAGFGHRSPAVVAALLVASALGAAGLAAVARRSGTSPRG